MRPADHFFRGCAPVLSRQLSRIMKTTDHATLPRRISRPPVPLKLFFSPDKTRLVHRHRDNQPSSLLPAYNNHGALRTCPSSPTAPYIRRKPVVEQNRTAASRWRAITKYPPCRRWRLLRPRDVAATAAIAPAIGSNPSNTQTPETPHEVHLYETERAPHRR